MFEVTPDNVVRRDRRQRRLLLHESLPDRRAERDARSAARYPKLEAVQKADGKLGVAEVYKALGTVNQGAATVQAMVFEPEGPRPAPELRDGGKSATETSHSPSWNWASCSSENDGARLTTQDYRMTFSPLRLTFDGGTVVVTGGRDEDRANLPGVAFDPRTRTQRAEGRHVPGDRRVPAGEQDRLRGRGPRLQDATWTLTSRGPRSRTRPRPSPRGGRPAAAASSCCRPAPARRSRPSSPSAQAARPALVVTPTIDLLNQWYGELSRRSAATVGLLGGGYYDIQPLTVTTYDSAYIHLERWGNRFGLLVFDECHHLPGPDLRAGRGRQPRPVPPRPDRDAGAGRRQEQHVRRS